MTKTCRTCEQVFPLENYAKHKGRKDGHLEHCKGCISCKKKAIHAALGPEQQEAHKAKCKARYHADPERAKQVCEVYRKANPQWHNERSRAWRVANPEKSRAVVSASQAKHIAKDPAAFAAKCKAWRDANPEMYRAKYLRRRLLVGNQKFAAKDIIFLWNKTKGICVYCRRKLGLSPKDSKAYHVDHIIPVSKGGPNIISNLQCICPKCNMRKSAKLPHVFAAEFGRLF